MAESGWSARPPRVRLRTVLRRLGGSASLISSAATAVTGLAFTVGNLLLARAMSVSEYAVVALALVLITLGSSLGPLGQERIVVRRKLPVTPALCVRGSATAVAVAVTIAAVALFVYELLPGSVALIAAAVVGGGMALLAAGKFQSDGRYVVATMVAQGSNLLLLAAAVLVAVSGTGSSTVVLGLFALGLLAIGAGTWIALLRRAEPAAEVPVNWREAAAMTGLTALLMIFAAIERLVIPLMLSAEDLAHFAVLAAMTIAPFRMLQMGVGRTLAPRLRDAPTAAQRRRLIRHEALVVGGVGLALGVTLWFVVPVVEALVLEDKYSTPPPLLAIVLVAGAVRLVNGFSTATMTVLGDIRRLYLANLTSGLSLLLAVGAAWVGSRWGLAGLVGGTVFAWCCQAVATFLLVLPRLRGP